MEDATRNWSYACTLTGGLLIALGGFSGAMMMGAFPAMTGFAMPMMGGYAVPSGWLAGMAWWMGGVGVVAGALVLYAAYGLRAGNANAGTLAIVGGAISLLAMGGWIVGAALAIVGGVLALQGQRASFKQPAER